MLCESPKNQKGRYQLRGPPSGGEIKRVRMLSLSLLTHIYKLAEEVRQ
jgi:hypothetical protein